MMKSVFKPYNQNQMHLLLPSLDEIIPPTHPVQVVNKVLDNLNIDFLLQTYKYGATSSFDT